MDEATINTMIAEFWEAIRSCRLNKAYTFNGRQVTRQDIPALLEAIKALKEEKATIVAQMDNLPSYVTTKFVSKW